MSTEPPTDLKRAAAVPELPPLIEEIEALTGRLILDMGEGWRVGRDPTAADYFEYYPHLVQHPEAAVWLVYEEICQRWSRSPGCDPEPVLAKYPRWRDELLVLLECHQAVHDRITTEDDTPQAGTTFDDFRLISELGRGSRGRVFLAAQGSLADRPVVVKLSSHDGSEHLSLARLDHPHIVPLYAAPVESITGQRILVMPYLGGTSLADLLKGLQAVRPAERHGRDLVGQLDALGLERPRPSRAIGTARVWLAGVSYPQAIAWWGACLADGLAAAHTRNLLHLDMKPGNVLIADDGRPLLLDFHLSRPPLARGESAPEWLGGTPAYMAPEQRAACQAVRDRQLLPQSVDGRADLYGLGVILYEALAGQLLPRSGSLVPALLRANPAVPRSLADVLARTLAHDPAERYSSAAELRDDLRRLASDQAPQGVRVRSIRERWARWWRRHPLMPLLVVVVLALATAAGVVVADGRHRSERARMALFEGQARLAQGAFAEACEIVRGGVELIDGLPFTHELQRQLRDTWSEAADARAGEDLETTVDRLRFHGGPWTPPAESLATLRAATSAVWAERQRLARSVPADPPTRDRRTDLLDLTAFLADLDLRVGEPARARERLVEARALLGSSAALEWLEQRLAGEPLPSELPRTATPAERFRLAEQLIQAERDDEALVLLERLVAEAPGAFWPVFQRAACLARRGDYDAAAQGFEICVALRPSEPACRINRDRCREAQRSRSE